MPVQNISREGVEDRRVLLRRVAVVLVQVVKELQLRPGDLDLRVGQPRHRKEARGAFPRGGEVAVDGDVKVGVQDLVATAKTRVVPHDGGGSLPAETARFIAVVHVLVHEVVTPAHELVVEAIHETVGVIDALTGNVDWHRMPVVPNNVLQLGREALRGDGGRGHFLRQPGRQSIAEPAAGVLPTGTGVVGRDT